MSAKWESLFVGGADDGFIEFVIEEVLIFYFLNELMSGLGFFLGDCAKASSLIIEEDVHDWISRSFFQKWAEHGVFPSIFAGN